MDRETMMKTMRASISNVLETMFFQSVQISDTNCSLQEWFSNAQLLFGVSLSFNGPSAGSFYFLLPATMVTGITANFLGIEEEEINEEQKKDAVKEALNMIGGHMLSLFDKEGAFKLGIPELIEENDLAEDNLGDLKKDIILIETEENRLAAGIQIET
ncbi:MAG: chemotaxis protein CheX [Deltaproteobacteria bacterium]|nr:chemotaxis protein CheX [Deltaproteobacteria bacterium]